MASEDRVRKGAEKLEKFLNAKQQGRLDGFFAVKPKTSPTKGKAEEKGKGKGTKRKVRISMSLYRRSACSYIVLSGRRQSEGQERHRKQ